MPIKSMPTNFLLNLHEWDNNVYFMYFSTLNTMTE